MIFKMSKMAAVLSLKQHIAQEARAMLNTAAREQDQTREGLTDANPGRCNR
jgi:hypothetical protein